MQQSGDNKLLTKNQAGVCMPPYQGITTHYFIYVDRIFQDLKVVHPNFDALKLRTNTACSKTKRMIWLAKFLTAAASIAILMGTATLVYTLDNNQLTSYANDVNPTSDRAILTLFKETKFKLSDIGRSSLLNRFSIEIGKAKVSSLVYEVA